MHDSIASAKKKHSISLTHLRTTDYLHIDIVNFLNSFVVSNHGHYKNH